MPSQPAHRSRPIIHFIFALPAILVIAQCLWPLSAPVLVKVAAAALLLTASQFHLWSRLSSGSVFAPEFPRRIVILFNWASGAILFLALLQLLLDAVRLGLWVLPGGDPVTSDVVRYLMAATAGLLAAIGVLNAVRVPLLKSRRCA